MSQALQARSETTVAKILSAAQTLFLSRTYADVTLDDIGRLAHVTKGGLYHHFRSKEQLYLELLHRDLDQKRELFSQATRSGGSCRSRLDRLTRAYLNLSAEQRMLVRLVRRDINIFVDPERANLIRAYQNALPHQVEAILEDGVRDGELLDADARLQSWFFVALVEVALGDYATEVLPDIESKLNHVLNLFFDGASASANGA